MSADDELSRRILEGTSYEHAEATTNRVFPVSLDGKILLAVGGLASTVVLAPALFVRRDLIRALEGTGALSETLSPGIAVLALVGVATTFGVGLLLVRQRYAVRARSLDLETARKLVRIEDFLMWFLVQGVLFIVVPALLAVAGVLSAGTIEALYESNVVVYQPAGTLAVDARIVSGLGGGLAAVLFGLWWYATSVASV